MSNRKRRAILGYLTDVGGTFVRTLALLIATPIILSRTSDALYGFWVTTLSILAYLSLTELGIGISLTRAVARHSDSADGATLNRKISTAFFTFCIAGALVLALALTVAASLPTGFGVPPDQARQAFIAYTIAVLAGACALPLATFTSVVLGFQRMSFNNTVSTIVSLLSIVVILTLLFAGFGIVALALSQLAAVFSIGLINAWYARRCFPELSIRLRFANRSDLAELFSFGGYFQVGTLARTVVASTDPLILSCFMGASFVTPYTVTSKLATFFSAGMASKLPLALFPGLTQLYQAGDVARVRQIYVKLSAVAVRMAIVAAVCIALVNREFVSLWVGAGRFGGAALTAVFVLWILQDTVHYGTATVLYSSGSLRGWAIASLAEAVLNLGLSCTLVHSLGLVGVALATFIAKLFTNTWYVPYRVCRTLELPIRDYLRLAILVPACWSLPGVGIAVLAAYTVPASLGWLWLAIVAFLAAGGNILFFEAVDFSRTPATSWRERLRLIITTQ